MDEQLLTVLRVHNPWLDRPGEQPDLLRARLPVRFVPRRHELELRPGAVSLVVGPRQAGKSTWIRERLARLTDPVLELNAEEPRIRELGTSPAALLGALGGVLSDATVLLLDS